MSPTTTMPPDEAANTLASIRTTRERTRGDLRTYWFPAVLFGVLTLLSAPLFSVWDGAAVGLFWLVAAPAGVVAAIRHARAHDDGLGVTRPSLPYAITAGCIATGCFSLGFGGAIADQPDVANFGPPLVVAIGYLVFAWLERSVALGLVALTLGALTVALAFADVANGGQLLALAYGVGFVVLGLLARTWSKTTSR